MKPNTELQDATTDLYLVAWEDLVTEYGQDRFRAALWKALRKTEFFPSPNMIETFCLELRAADREQARIAREAAEQAEIDEYLADVRTHPDKYFSVSEMVAEVLAKHKPRPQHIDSGPIVHSVTITPFGSGAYDQSCSCGKTWHTVGSVPACPGENWNAHVAQVEAGLNQLRKAS